uniref:hypothetical protein n=2 Tax=unclassified Brucella TaxID=2632610 RepID=UPI003B981D81
TFYVGSGTQTRLDLYMQWNGKNLPRASLAFADNDPSANASLTAPTIKELTGTVLNIPTGCPIMPFKVNLPTDTTLRPNDKVAFILNDRIVYNGRAEQALPNADGIDVAYATLDVSGGTNKLIYVAYNGAWKQSKPLSFTAQGTPQTGPCNISDRPLPAPAIDMVSPFQSVTPSKVTPVFEVYVDATNLKEDDEVTLFFYLQGNDVLSAQMGKGAVTIHNVVPVTEYTLEPTFLDIDANMWTPARIYTLPQWAVAGYASATTDTGPTGAGIIQIDYMVVSNGKTTWSKVASYTLNSTI